MEISICVDKYIYKKKSISVEDASKYINEIAVYGTQCKGDIHSLQVIEKLTRCMKTIIEEANKSISQIHNVFTKETESFEALSALPTNDNQSKVICNGAENIVLNPDFPGKTVGNQNNTGYVPQFKDTVHNVMSKEKESIDMFSEMSFNNSQDKVIYNNSNNNNNNAMNPDLPCNIENQNTETSSIIVIDSDDDIQENMLTEIEQNENICDNSRYTADSLLGTTKTAHEGISGIREKNVIKIPFSENNYLAQKSIFMSSTINISDPVNVGNDNISNVLTETTKNESILKNIVNPRQTYSNAQSKFTSPSSIDNTDATKIEENKNILTTVKPPGRKRLNTNKKNKNLSEAVENTPIEKKKRRKPQNKASTEKLATNKISGKRKNKNQIDEFRNTYDAHNSSQLSMKSDTYYSNVPNINNPLVNIINNEITASQQDSRNLSANDETLISNQMDSLKIYNEQIENDLSWVENIRFVREVSNDEFDPKFSNLEETFWDNFTLPIDWNDNEFTY